MNDSEQAFTEWSQKQIDTLWAERSRLEGENASLRAQLAEAQAKECKPGCMTLMATETERNAAETRAEAAEERASAWQEKALGEAGKQEFDEVVQMCREAQARAEAAESAAGVMREALEREPYYVCARHGRVGGEHRCAVFDGHPSKHPALAHPEAQGERVKLEALASAARKVLAVCDVPVMMAMPQSSIELLQELREALAALDTTGKEGI